MIHNHSSAIPRDERWTKGCFGSDKTLSTPFLDYEVPKKTARWRDSHFPRPDDAVQFARS